MDYLLDTHTFLWFINGDNRLSTSARKAIENSETLKYLSAASFWEMAIKYSIGKLELDMPFTDLKRHVIDNGFESLPTTFEHANQLTELTFHHRDPFDRMIIAQAMTEHLIIITKDSIFKKYYKEILW